MTQQDEISLPLFRGSEDEVLFKLWTICYSYGGVGDEDVYAALAHILDGGRFVQCAGERFEVVEIEWSLIQDIYGCELGRDCTEITPDQRAACEVLIALLEAGS